MDEPYHTLITYAPDGVHPDYHDRLIGPDAYVHDSTLRIPVGDAPWIEGALRALDDQVSGSVTGRDLTQPAVAPIALVIPGWA